ncbi:hypothetical protein HIM_05325 [Hirsutella minnesotensis 3608]|uniref:non-specific serine/threonine protein kinase n=1 Tax=Hirsutella minnesotensis 3608 TaxID=1043627 RepID=A0A0F8A5I7_9HYPO|nr:hypothetical protein HIM_05325 [Hirsutella minnesotensis 3608]
MSLIPYHPREGRDVVLRHHTSVVVRDPDSQRLEIRRTECPTCHQPLGRASSPDGPLERNYDMDNEYVDPNYFRMLRAGNQSAVSANGPSSPVRRLFHPALASGSSDNTSSTTEFLRDEAEFVSSAPGVGQAEGSRIRRDAFSPNYFKTFFVEETVLGRGGKGVVLLVRHEIDGCQLGHFACKRVPVGDDHAWLEKVLIEVELLAKLTHPNLVSYRHVWLEDVQLTRFGPRVACAFILQQYCNGGDLHQYVVGSAPREATKEELKAQMRRRSKGQAEQPQNLSQGRPRLSFEDIYSFFKDITSGVAYLHAANYIHRDLKPSNCLLHREGGTTQCLISDFGEVQSENMVRKSTGSTGTISYCAPEVLKMDAFGRYGNFTTKSDMFSLGMILYFMCFGRLPYQGANAIQEELEDIEQLRAEITDWKGFQDERRERPDLPNRLYMLLKKLLSLDPVERPSANEVLIAMRSETSFDDITRGERGSIPPVSSRGSRIQSLDSPAPPGTPVSDSKKEIIRSRVTPHEESSPWSRPGEHNVMPSNESNGTASSQPTAGISQRRGRSLSPLENDDGHFSMVRDEDCSPARRSQNTFSPPLLMAPPRTRSGELRYQVDMALHRASVAVRHRWHLLNFAVRLSFFLIKLFTLARPCWPVATSLEVSVPLVIMAAIDLGLPGGGTRSVLGFQHASNREPASDRRSVPTGLGTSLVLLIAHVAVLWLARKWNRLCVTVTKGDWVDW